MPIQIPTGDTYFPDTEILMVQVLEQFLDQLEPKGYSCILPPADMDSRLDDGQAIVMVRRVGGQATRTMDTARVNVTVIASSRADGWKVLGWLRPRLHSFNGAVTMPDGTTAHVSDVEDARGTERSLPLTQDSRAASAEFYIHTRLTR